MPSIPFATAGIDRAAHRRTDAGWLAASRAGALALDLADGSITPLDGRAALALLGETAEGRALWLLPGTAGPDLRGVAAAADARRQGLLAYAAHLAWWHATHAFCGRCGAPTDVRDAGFLRVCAEGHPHHPRTDPVVIMLVADGPDRVLLGRQPSWPRGRYSALAGFVEPGESLEAAVAREVREEAGVAVGGVRYMASQPWPFPGSLMLGFHAEYAGGDAAPQDLELEDVRWFGRAEVEEAAREDVPWVEDDAGDRLLIPPVLAIARHLLEDWLATVPS